MTAALPNPPNHPPPRAARTPRGISLLGMLASLAVIAVLAGLVIPAFFGRHNVTLDNAAILLARDLRSVQNRAAHLGQNTRLRFDTHGWRAFDERGRPLARFASAERIERDLDADAVFEGVTLESVDFGPTREIEFDSSGRPIDGGSLELMFRGHRRRLTLDGASGRVAISGLTRPWSDEGP